MIPVIEDDYVEIEIELPEDLVNKLMTISKKTGKTIDKIVQEAIWELKTGK